MIPLTMEIDSCDNKCGSTYINDLCVCMCMWHKHTDIYTIYVHAYIDKSRQNWKMQTIA